MVLAINGGNDFLPCQGRYNSTVLACGYFFILIMQSFAHKAIIQILAKRAFLEARPLQIVSVALAAGSVFYVSKLALKDLKE